LLQHGVQSQLVASDLQSGEKLKANLDRIQDVNQPLNDAISFDEYARLITILYF